jgi:hypothetical protein
LDIRHNFSFLFKIQNVPVNHLVILAVAKDPYKNIRTPFNYLMRNLALADLIVGTVTDPMSIYNHWKEGINAKLLKSVVQIFHISY